MGFRTVVVKSRVKLELRLIFLIVRGEVEKKIFLSEINTLIIQSTAVSMTAALLSELAKNNIKVIFCDEKCSPVAELAPYYGAHNTSKRYRQQVAWTNENKSRIWRKIVERKILEQSKVLVDMGKVEASAMLVEYAADVTDGDATNREGHAAKVYFHALFDGGGRRDDTVRNGYLNYGYAVLLSAFNREIVACGYMTQLGIWHENEFNNFNLSSDLMEPFRPYVDRIAMRLTEHDEDFKRKFIDLLNYDVRIDDKKTTMDLAIRRYVYSVMQCLQSGDLDDLAFVEEVAWKDEL